MLMSKRPTMTRKRVAANQANGKLSKGPATPEGRERIRAANTRHGFYSRAEGVALACLGEDAAELERLRQNLYGDFQPPSGMEEELVEHLAQVVWRWKRAGRMQEGFALRQAKDANLTREDRLHAQMMRLKITADTLRRLAQSVAREDYFTPREDLEMMKNLHQEGAVKEIGEIALALFFQLQKPGTGKDGEDPEEKTRRVMNKIRAIFGLGPLDEEAVLVPNLQPSGPQVDGGAEVDVVPAWSQPQESQQIRFADSDGVPQTPEIGDPATSGQVTGAAEQDEAPDFSPARADLKVGATGEDEPDDISPEEEAHERARQLLENLLTRQVELCEAQRSAILQESLAGPSPYERAAEIALAHPNVALMQRMEESSFRQIWRITNLLLKMKQQK